MSPRSWCAHTAMCAALAAIAEILTAMPSCGASGAPVQDGPVPVAGKTMDDAILKALSEVSAATYFRMPPQLPEGLQSRVRNVPPGVLRLGAPAQVDLAKESKLPLLYLSGETDAHLELVPSRENTALLAIDLGSGIARAVVAFPDDPSKTLPPETPRAKPRVFPRAETPPPPAPRDPEDPPDFPARADSVGQVWLDARALDAVAWSSGSVVLRVSCFDRITNAVRVELAAAGEKVAVPQGFPADLARDLELETRRFEASASPEKSFARSDATPKLGAAGAALAVPKSLREGEKSCAIHGACKLALPAGALVDLARRANKDDTAEIPLADLPAAVVRAWVAVASLDVVPPRLVEVQIPVRSATPLRVGAPVELAFSVDLFAEMDCVLPPGTYFLCLLAGEHATEPIRLDVAPR